MVLKILYLCINTTNFLKKKLPVLFLKKINNIYNIFIHYIKYITHDIRIKSFLV